VQNERTQERAESKAAFKLKVIRFWEFHGENVAYSCVKCGIDVYEEEFMQDLSSCKIPPDRGLCFNCLSDMNGVDALEFLKMVFFISNLKPEDAT
jgi:NAD-dependent SIR2 family protein deacetylase